MADAAKSKRNGAGVKRAKKEPTLIAAIKAAGGLRSEFARDLTGETPRRANQMYPFAFRRNGVDLSTMVHNGLLDDFLPPNLRNDVFNTPMRRRIQTRRSPTSRMPFATAKRRICGHGIRRWRLLRTP